MDQENPSLRPEAKQTNGELFVVGIHTSGHGGSRNLPDHRSENPRCPLFLCLEIPKLEMVFLLVTTPQ